jgi:hypothetical protein
MCFWATAEPVALHSALEAAALGCANDIDDISSSEGVGLEDLSNLNAAIVIRLELAKGPDLMSTCPDMPLLRLI